MKALQVHAQSSSNPTTSAVPALPAQPSPLMAVASPIGTTSTSQGATRPSASVGGAGMPAGQLQALVQAEVAAAVAAATGSLEASVVDLRKQLLSTQEQLKAAQGRLATAESAASRASAAAAVARAAADEAASETAGLRRALDSSAKVGRAAQAPRQTPVSPTTPERKAGAMGGQPATPTASASPHKRGGGLAALQADLRAGSGLGSPPRGGPRSSSAVDPRFRTPEPTEAELPGRSKSVQKGMVGSAGEPLSLAGLATATAGLAEEVARLTSTVGEVQVACHENASQMQGLAGMLGAGVDAAVDAKVTARLGPVPPQAVFSSLQALQAEVAVLGEQLSQLASQGGRGGSHTPRGSARQEQALVSTSTLQALGGIGRKPVLGPLSPHPGGGSSAEYAARTQAHAVMRTVMAVSAAVEGLTADFLNMQGEMTALSAEVHSAALGVRSLAGDAARERAQAARAMQRLSTAVQAAAQDTSSSVHALQEDVHSRLQSVASGSSRAVAACAASIASVQASLGSLEARLARTLSADLKRELQGSGVDQAAPQSAVEEVRAALEREIGARVRSWRALEKRLSASPGVAATCPASTPAGPDVQQALVKLEARLEEVAAREQAPPHAAPAAAPPDSAAEIFSLLGVSQVAPAASSLQAEGSGHGSSRQRAPTPMAHGEEDEDLSDIIGVGPPLRKNRQPLTANQSALHARALKRTLSMRAAAESEPSGLCTPVSAGSSPQDGLPASSEESATPLWRLLPGMHSEEQASEEDMQEAIGLWPARPTAVPGIAQAVAQTAIRSAVRQAANALAPPRLVIGAGEREALLARGAVARWLGVPAHRLAGRGLLPLLVSCVAALMQLRSAHVEGGGVRRVTPSGSGQEGAAPSGAGVRDGVLRRVEELEAGVAALKAFAVDSSVDSAPSAMPATAHSQAAQARLVVELDTVQQAVQQVRRRVAALEGSARGGAVDEVVSRAVPLVVTAASDDVAEVAIGEVQAFLATYSASGMLPEREAQEVQAWLEGGESEAGLQAGPGEGSTQATFAPTPTSIGAKRVRSAREADMGAEHFHDSASETSGTSSGSSSDSSTDGEGASQGGPEVAEEDGQDAAL